MEALLQAFRDMGQKKIAVMVVTVIAILGLFIFVSARFSSQTMSPLYTDLSLDDSAKIVSELDKMNVPYDLRANGSQILVPSEQVLRLRLSLAQQGLPAVGSIVGYEIFDRSETMGTSSFVMNINMLRALEGELARTIASLSQVESARVHLVMPKQEIFSHDKQEATASVVLKLRGVSELTKEEVSGITHLVAASVPSLKPSRVTVVDSKGHMLAGGNGDDSDVSVAASTTEEYRIAYQTHMRNTLESLLEKSLGSGKVKVTVNADIDFDRIVTNSETFDPNGQVARSVQSGEEKEQSGEKEGSANTTASNNLPGAQGNQTSGGSSRVVDKTDETTNYEISKTVQNHIQEAGKVNRLSVAVMVDGTYADDKSGKQVYTPRTPDELKQIDTLVKSAIGYDEKRGDNVQVVNMRFIAGEEGTNQSFLDSLRQDLHGVIQTLVFGAVAALVILLIIRPVVMRIMETTMAAAVEETATVPQMPLMGAAPAAPRPMAAGGAEEAAGGAPEEESIDLSRVTGRVKSSSYNRLNELLERHPEEALNVIRQWAAKRT